MDRKLAEGASPLENYARLLSERQLTLAGCRKRQDLLGNIRVAVFFGAAAAAYLAFVKETFSPWWLLAFVGIYFWLGGTLRKVEEEIGALSRAIDFYNRATERLHGRWAGSGESGTRFLERNHLYAADLDLFGSGSLFELISLARTRMGEETLASWLSNPAAAEEVKARQDAVTELGPRLDLREDLAVLAETARKGVMPKAMSAWGEGPPVLKVTNFRYVAWGLSFLGFLAVFAFLASLLVQFGMLGLPEATSSWLRIFFLVMAVLYTLLLRRFKSRTDRIIQELEAAAHNLDLIAGVLARLETERFHCVKLVALRADLDAEGQPPTTRIRKLHRLMEFVDSRHHDVMKILGPLLLWDIHLSYAIEDWRRTSGASVRRWFDALGEMEALSSLACYHYEHPEDVFPRIAEGIACFEGEGLGHPLIEESRAIRNDLKIGGDLQALVVSGSNMSGKSTFLRTVGLNAVLAQAGAPVRAKSLSLSPLRVGASIRIQDSLQENTSLFYAEITRLRDIMKACDGETPVLFLIDELLHGTNSHDRRIGAEAIVHGLVSRGAIGLVTTHDLALADVADKMGVKAANVHFEDYLEDGKMRFDYRMRAGRVEKSNAIALMRAVGLEV